MKLNFASLAAMLVLAVNAAPAPGVVERYVRVVFSMLAFPDPVESNGLDNIASQLSLTNAFESTKTGQGARIEAISRGVIGLIVPGGSEDVMIDLGVREALKLSKAKGTGSSKL